MEKFLDSHPILNIPEQEEVEFYFNGKTMTAPKGMVISSALIANGIHIMNHHPKDELPQGIFCANGQCSQCLLLADGVPVKSCITEVEPGMKVEQLIGLPDVGKIPAEGTRFDPVRDISCDVLIIGGGPAGLSAALFLSRYPLNIILVEDKPEPGGKLTLQTHQFFGSIADCYAGTRGTDIAKMLTREIEGKENVRIYPNSTAVAVYEDRKIGVFSRQGYFNITPKILLNSAGAREKMLHFPGSYLPNVYGAGAFQTLVNRDLVKPADKILIIGGGNVGLIAAYHALQADIDVIAVLEALPEVSGYKVHRDKIIRLGIPVLTSHTILDCFGDEKVEKVEFAQIDENFQPIPGTEKSVEVDAVLIGVGLTPIDELSKKAEEIGIECFQAGDAQEIAEASAAFFGGKIAAAKIAASLKLDDKYDPAWNSKMEVLKSRPGKSIDLRYPEEIRNKFQPVLHCYQSIPCNPCSTVCPKDVIYIPEDDLMAIPELVSNDCIGCFRCVAFCPGLAITLVKKDNDRFYTYIAYELNPDRLDINQEVSLTDLEGKVTGKGTVTRIFSRPPDKVRNIIEIETDEKTAILSAGIRLFSSEIETTEINREKYGENPEFICRCEHITRKEIGEMIEAGITDINMMKSVQRVSMGACGGKSCSENIRKLMAREGVDREKNIPNTARPFMMEIKLKDFANLKEGPEDEL